MPPDSDGVSGASSFFGVGCIEAHVGKLVVLLSWHGHLPVLTGRDTGWKPVPHQMAHMSRL